MLASRSNRLPFNLPHLQNCIKKDPSAYEEEFKLQYRHYESILQIMMFNPAYFDKEFEALITFLAHTVPCYKSKITEFPEQIKNLLMNFSTSLHRDSRLACCRALIILRSRDYIPLQSLLPLFFVLSRCQDKNLRSYVKQNIISDIKNMNKKSRNEKLNKELQRFMFEKLSNEQQENVTKLALDIMIDLYKKNVWRNKELVNQIALSCLSRTPKILITCLQFFLGTDEDADEEGSSDEEDSRMDKINQLKETIKANKHNKSSRKRDKILAKVKKTVKTIENKEKNEQINFSAIYLINDPQTLAEKLFNYVESTNQRFEIKIMMMNLISRLIGAHELQLVNFYAYIAKYLTPHQTDVTKMLQYAAQSCHKLVPSNEIEPVVKAITYNFVTDKNSTEAITVGLNAIREICARNHEVMDEDLLQDLTQYQKYKNKNVSSAAKSLIHLYRLKNPNLLSRKDRGRPLDESLKRSHSVMSFEDLEMDSDDSGEDVDMDLETASEEEFDSDEEGEVNSEYSDDQEEEAEDEETDEEKEQLLNPSDKVSLRDIERLYKRPRHDKESRLATVIEGRDGREQYGKRKPKLNAKSSTSNRDKRKHKAFGMIKHKLKRHKKAKTFHEKQLDLKQKTLKQAKLKR